MLKATGQPLSPFAAGGNAGYGVWDRKIMQFLPCSYLHASLAGRSLAAVSMKLIPIMGPALMMSCLYCSSKSTTRGSSLAYSGPRI